MDRTFELPDSIKGLAAAAVVAATLVACANVRVVQEPNAAITGGARQAAETVLVQAGDTLYGIASRHGLKVGDVAAWNGLAPPYTIWPKQRLRLTPLAAAAATTRPLSPASAVTSSPLVLPSSSAALGTIVSDPRKLPDVSAGSATAAWQWPAEGGVAPRASGTAPTMVIAGRGGAPVRAAADGVVLYSGTGAPGYEELIVIRHNGEWLTSYARNRKRLVGEGQRVQAGAQIAEMGQDESLYFEMRRDGELVDPLTVLPPR